nr:hypothetical protein [Tanacetum cinerariifolium]
MWKAIKTRNLGTDRVKETRLQTLITKFENLKMLDIGTTYEYAAKLSGIASKSVTIGKVMSEHKLVKKFLTSLPIRFVHIVAALEQVLDLKTTGFEDVIGRLKAYEERIRQEDKANDPQENLLYARTEYSKGNNDSSEGKGRGSYSRDRGREKYTPPKSESNTDDEDDVWYFDNGASNRMTSNYSYFSELNENITGRVSWGSLLIKVSRSANRLYKAQLKVSKEGTNEVGRESGTFTLLCNGIEENVTNQVVDEEVNPHSSSITIHETNLEGEEVESGSNDTCIPIARLKTIRLLIALAAGKGWKIHHLDVKKAFLSGTSPITWCSQKQTPVALSSCEAEFIAATTAACQLIWRREVLAEVTGNEQVIVKHVLGENQRADPLTKALARIRFKEMRSLLGSAHGSTYGSAPVDDDSPVEETSPVKAKKASKRVSRAKKNDIMEKEPPKDMTKA